jgi:dTDP-4-amino-4,6-dideoxygalactose transaminase
MPVALPGRAAGARSSWHLYVIRLNDPGLHRRTFEALRQAGIGVNLHYIPVHLQPYYRGLGFGEGDFPAAEEYYARAISIPLHPALSEDEQDYIASTLETLIS